MNPKKFIKSIPSIYPLEFNSQNYKIAQEFVMIKWSERFEERKKSWEITNEDTYYLNKPTDLSMSCKFTSLFAAVIFEGVIAGNKDHQYSVIGNKVIDLNSEAADVLKLKNPHDHDVLFISNPEHRESMKSCAKRVQEWVNDFLSYLESKKIKKKTITF